MSIFTTTKFWADSTERAIKTAAQSALGVLGAGALGVLDVDWANLGSVAALATVVSLLTSVASGTKGDPNTASLID